MINNNQQVFFALVRAGLWEEKEVRLLPYGDIKWPEIYRLATEQSVLGLVLAGLEYSDLKPPKVLLLQWIGELQVIEQRNKDMNAFVAELIEKLRKEDVYTILVKGQGIAQCYERPLWRASGDIDFFLSENNYQKAKTLLIPQSDSVDAEVVSNKHIGMTVKGWMVELHGSLCNSLSKRINKTLNEIQNDVFYGGIVRSWINNNTQVFLMGVDGDVIYIFVHFLGHFYKGGVGLRQICDWCRLIWKYKESLNYALLEARIKKMGLKTEWKAFAAFAVDYLGMPSDTMPLYSSDAKWKRKAKRICSFIMGVGNMGWIFRSIVGHRFR